MTARAPTAIATLWSARPRAYDGRALSSHFALRELGVAGDSIVAFVGPCRVPLSRMVDLIDAREGKPIRAARMLHFIAEHFEDSLDLAILRQHLFSATVAEEVRRAAGPGAAVERRGNDLFVGRRKLTVSIAAKSPVSTLLHVGVNVDPAGAPVPAVGLKELGVEAEPLARRLLGLYALECAIAARSRAKARPVS